MNSLRFPEISEHIAGGIKLEDIVAQILKAEEELYEVKLAINSGETVQRQLEEIMDAIQSLEMLARKIAKKHEIDLEEIDYAMFYVIAKNEARGYYE